MTPYDLVGTISPAIVLLFAATLYALIDWTIRNPQYNERRLNALLVLASFTVIALACWSHYYATHSYPAG